MYVNTQYIEKQIISNARSGRSNLPHAASLVRPTRPADEPQSFISALREKYAPGDTENADDGTSQIRFGTKIAQEMGFDKIRRKFAQVKELKSVILDGMRIHKARSPGEDAIGETCPNLTQVDVSRNLFTGLEPVMDICEDLPSLKTLRLKFVLSSWHFLQRAQLTVR